MPCFDALILSDATPGSGILHPVQSYYFAPDLVTLYEFLLVQQKGT